MRLCDPACAKPSDFMPVQPGLAHLGVSRPPWSPNHGSTSCVAFKDTQQSTSLLLGESHVNAKINAVKKDVQISLVFEHTSFPYI
eukprot:scaffold7575_cov159-Amphora_coffeaeformis.AAC.8